MLANSTPTAPEPITISDFGMCVEAEHLDVGQNLLVGRMPGSMRATEPVERITFFALIDFLLVALDSDSVNAILRRARSACR